MQFCYRGCFQLIGAKGTRFIMWNREQKKQRANSPQECLQVTNRWTSLTSCLLCPEHLLGQQLLGPYHTNPVSQEGQVTSILPLTIWGLVVLTQRAKECVAWQKLYSSNYSWALNDYSRKSVSSEVKMIGMINVYLLEKIRIHLWDQLGACLWGIFRLELAGREHT